MSSTETDDLSPRRRDSAAFRPFPASTGWRPRALLIVALLAVTAIAYLPALGAGFVWDDDEYVTGNRTLREPGGLRSIWLDPTSTPQYYPVVHTTFWLEYRLWGLDARGYHLVNVLLHATNAALLWAVLARLRIRGALLAAFLFALHPVHVESVAWITERKNVLSGCFFLLALLGYLRFDNPAAVEVSPETRRRRFYWLSMALFLCALLSKTVTCSFPAVVMLLIWWRRGRIARRDLAALLPMFVLGAALASVTVWLEAHHVGASGAEWALSAADRVLIAGRALWFYALELVWPSPLVFNYPRWEIDASRLWPYLLPLGVVLVCGALWWGRGRLGRGPLVAVLVFAGMLVPALGFVDVYPMRYSFVADHFQYLPSIGLLVLAAAGLRWLAVRPPRGIRVLSGVLIASVPLALGTLTYRQCRVYHDPVTLWQDTIAKNPDSWMAHYHLGWIHAEAGRLEEAERHYRLAAERSAPPNSHHSAALYNLGRVLEQLGRREEAENAYRRALEADPKLVNAMVSLGLLLKDRGRPAEAETLYRQALALDPKQVVALVNLGNALRIQGRFEEAVAHYREALAIDPGAADAWNGLANARLAEGRPDEAAAAYRKALEVAPDHAPAHLNLAGLLAARGQPDRAVEHLDAVARLESRDRQTVGNLAVAYARLRRPAKAAEQYRRLLRLDPGNLRSTGSLAWLLATCPDDAVRDGAEAVHLAGQAAAAAGGEDPILLDVLAAAQAEAGAFDQAIATAERAAALAVRKGNEPVRQAILRRLALYRTRQPFRTE